MIPDLQRAVALDLTDNAIRSRHAVMRSLEDVRNLLRNGNGEDEEIYMC